MRVSFEWLKDFVSISATPEEVSHSLTMAGLEVEGIDTSVGGDSVFEVNVTPNRPDCLSILGIAREVAAAYRLPLEMPGDDIQGDLPASDIRVEILNPELCHRYTGRLIKGVTISGSPEWLKNRLEKCGIRSLNNNIVDITNYVLLEMGHPLHAFDADKLSGSVIKVSKAGKKRSITTLDGIERELSGDSLLIMDAKKTLALAGVMGGEDSSVTSGTRNIFLESAFFAPVSVRRTSKELGLRTESSYRFERGTDIEFLENALNRAALLIRETGGGIIHEIVDVYPEKFKPATIEVNYARVNALLGVKLEKGEMLKSLERIGIVVEDRGEVFHAFPPAFRRDITGHIDIVEEIARTFGYGNIPARLPKTILSGGVLNHRERGINRIRETVRKTGFNEVINYSFMSPSDLDMISIPVGDIRRRHLSLRNPLKQEDSLMRTTLIPALINNFAYNFSMGARDIRLFEISKIFIAETDRLPTEGLRMGGIFYRENIPSLWKESAQAFFIVKGALQSLFEEMKLGGYTFVPSEEVFLHRGKSADIELKGTKAGFIGELVPDIAESLNLKVRKPEIIVFELNIDTILAFLPERLTYRHVPKYPFIERDIAIIIDDSLTAAWVMDVINSFRSEFIETVEIFDCYKGGNIPAGRKSLAFRIIYRSGDRTLTDNEVESVHRELLEYVLEKTGGELRYRT